MEQTKTEAEVAQIEISKNIYIWDLCQKISQIFMKWKETDEDLLAEEIRVLERFEIMMDYIILGQQKKGEGQARSRGEKEMIHAYVVACKVSKYIDISVTNFVKGSRNLFGDLRHGREISDEELEKWGGFYQRISSLFAGK